MNMIKGASFIPLEIGDLIKNKNYKNKYLLKDIFQVISCKNKQVEIYLELIDISNNTRVIYPYEKDIWTIIKTNEELKGVDLEDEIFD